MFREKNSAGFIKAFSDAPEAFASGFAPLSTMLKNLHLRVPALWPRFHVDVAASLEPENQRAEVVELAVGLSDSMAHIQLAINTCIEASLSEIKKGNAKEVDMGEWTLEAALHRSFDVIVRRQLDPVWHRVSAKTRQLVGDLKELREMLGYLVTHDAVAFYQYLEGILATQSTNANGNTRMNQSPWLFLDAAQIIFDTAKSRVFLGKLTKAQQQEGLAENGRLPEGLVPVLEEQPKWAALSGILDEIERETHLNPEPASESYGTVLIMCSDSKECRQLKEYLQTAGREPGEDEDEDTDDEDEDGEEGRTTHSAAYMMRRRLRGYLAWKQDLVRFKVICSDTSRSGGVGMAPPQNRGQKPEPFRGRGAPANKRRRTRGGSAAAAEVGPSRAGTSVQIVDDASGQVAQLWQSLQPTEAEQSVKPEIAVDPLDNMADFYELFDYKDLVVVHPFKGDMDDRLLEELRPSYIVMYNPDTAFVRRVEMYRSSHRDRRVKVFFMYYADSVEEQRFLSAVRKEKDAFSKLIQEKGTLAVTLDTNAVDDPQEVFLRTINTRKAGGGKLATTVEKPRVIVDIREFRSSLPTLLHGKYTEIVPVTLTVGDYILAPDICVERKSIKDMIASFKNGRLYSQCEAMVLHYKYPVVLIEFEENKSFSLEPFSDLSTGIGQNDLQSKIVLLAIAFPKVRFIWSSSPYQTAEIFEDLKRGREEPDPDTAVRLGLEEGEEANGTYNQTPQVGFLRELRRRRDALSLGIGEVLPQAPVSSSKSNVGDAGEPVRVSSWRQLSPPSRRTFS